MIYVGYATINIYNDETNRRLMYEDFLVNDRYPSETKAINKLLQYFSDRFLEHGLNNSNYGLPEPESQKTELQIMRLRYDPIQQEQLYKKLITATKPTDEQSSFLKKVFNRRNIKNYFTR